MVRCRCHGASAVVSSRKSTRDGCLKKTFSITVIVDPLEKGKFCRVEGGGWVQRITHILDSHVRVSNDVAARKSLGGCVISRIGVCKRASDEICHLDGNVEGRIGLNGGTAGQWEGNNGRYHVRLGWDVTHGCKVSTVHRTRSLNLLIPLHDPVVI